MAGFRAYNDSNSFVLSRPRYCLITFFKTKVSIYVSHFPDKAIVAFEVPREPLQVEHSKMWLQGFWHRQVPYF